MSRLRAFHTKRIVRAVTMGKFLMRKMLCALVLAVVASQTVMPAFAIDNINIMSTTSGWRRQGGGAVMAYVRIPTGDNRKSDAQPRIGLKLVGGRSYDRNEVATHINNPTIVDFGFTARSLTSTWAPTLNFGHTVAWTSNPNVLPPSQRLRFMEAADWTWPIVGVASVGIGVLLAAQLD